MIASVLLRVFVVLLLVAVNAFFAAAESIYDKVKDGEKIFASTKAEVGIAVCA